MSINEDYVVKQYENNHSTYSIAKELGTYPKKIERILKKKGVERRTRSEAQKAAIETGRTEHPTKGRKRTEEEKVKISEGVYKNWKEMPEQQKEEISKKAKERWDDIPGLLTPETVVTSMSNGDMRVENGQVFVKVPNEDALPFVEN